jgi:hypothetical protein
VQQGYYNAEVMLGNVGCFYAEPKPAVTLRQPSRRWHLGKVWVEQSWHYTKL